VPEPAPVGADGGGRDGAGDQAEGQRERFLGRVPDVSEAGRGGGAGQRGEPAQGDRADGQGEEAGQDRHAARREAGEQLEDAGAERQGGGRDEDRAGGSGFAFLGDDQGVGEYQFLDSPGDVDEQQHPRDVSHPGIERQGEPDGERYPGQRDHPGRQGLPGAGRLGQGLEADAGQLGGDDYARGQLDEGDRGLGEADGAGGELADGDLGGGGAQQVARDQDEQARDHQQDRAAGRVLRVQQLEGDDRHHQRADDRQQHPQAGQQFGRDEEHAHDRAEQGRGRYLTPGLLDARGEAEREQGGADEAEPPAVGVGGGLEAGQFAAGRGRAELARDDPVDQELCLGHEVKPGQLGSDPDGVVIDRAVVVPDRQHRALGQREDLGLGAVGTAGRLHGVAQLERALRAVPQQEPGQAA
jgi:hypothetical protein